MLRANEARKESVAQGSKEDFEKLTKQIESCIKEAIKDGKASCVFKFSPETKVMEYKAYYRLIQHGYIVNKIIADDGSKLLIQWS